MTKYGHDQSLLILGSVVSHTLFLRECQQLFKPLITERAKKVQHNNYTVYTCNYTVHVYCFKLQWNISIVGHHWDKSKCPD